MELVTVETILSYLKDNIERKIQISPVKYIEAAEKLNVLREDEDDKLIELIFKVNQKKALFFSSGKSISAAKVLVEASEEYKDYLKQKAKCDRIIEFIRIQKIRARLKDSELHQY